MKTKYVPEVIERILNKAGIKINGSRDWDLQVKGCDFSFLKKVARYGNLGLGEAYLNGYFEVKILDEFFYRILKSKADREVKINLASIWLWLNAMLINQQNGRRSQVVAEQHYNLGNDLYRVMLGPTMTYTCGRWLEMCDSLDKAQEAKLAMICNKLKLERGMRLLDIGCGWGSLIAYATKHYGVRAVGITNSKEQAELAQEICQEQDAEIRVCDYREISEDGFDVIASVGMFEHVGVKNYRCFMEKTDKLLKPGGLFLLHTIGTDKTINVCDPFINKYIFPNSALPSMRQITKAYEGIFSLQHMENFGRDYDKTLMAWWQNFKTGWPKLKTNGKYDDKFYRMWRYYLMSTAACFRAERAHVWQLVFSKK